ncbi:PD-(D/E)XK nuclease family protein [Microbacterium capsulatum]|uniref:PD-(D/E)XK nuclease family protein n=1 Tax=Microbacterium capsulatum TaxID=3041921 RepID=A0ABU0XJN8_9MICO|nr:PD-(D/E)XK nuclease family protein [Microbacterium sp. ASV81]MDQ4215062.1 PD-(D/E)XK nuclease family protein [Microbacterium sp. ASV81]
MTDSPGALATGIAFSRAVLVGPPARWSYSTLEEASSCPLRYCLRRATYPDLGHQEGYPSVPSVPALFGNVVHGALEVVVKAMADAAVESPQAESAAEVIRDLGGFTSVVENELANQLASLKDNMRLSKDLHRRIAIDLEARVADARAQVQTYLSRTKFVSGPRHSTQAAEGGRSRAFVRQELGAGSHPEVELVAERERLYGRVDLLMISDDRVDIIDYKTGGESDGHADQLQLYAWLWGADEKVNPRGLGVASLTAAYRDQDVSIDVPNADQMAVLSLEFATKIADADGEIASGSPTARPSQENCRYCAVRHLCASYWATIAPKLSDINQGDLFDYEGVIGEQNGQRSWWLLNDAGRPELLLRTTTPAPPFASGDRVRLLGLRRGADPQTDWPIGSVTVATEAFRVESV